MLESFISSRKRGLGTAPFRQLVWFAALLLPVACDLQAQDVSASLAAATLHGNPYVPPGADFRIFGLQGIDATHPFGSSGFSPQVNTDFEYTPSIGVSYDTGASRLTDFGLGLYQPVHNGPLFSTGLQILYNQQVDAASVNITLLDFDITGTANFNFTQKVAPTLTLLGPNNSIFATFGPANIRPAMVEQTGGGKKGTDIWDISFATLLSNMHVADGAITGFVLGADMANGEKASDPYLLLSAGNGGPSVPEPSSLLLFAAAALIFLFKARRFFSRQGARSRQST